MSKHFYGEQKNSKKNQQISENFIYKDYTFSEDGVNKTFKVKVIKNSEINFEGIKKIKLNKIVPIKYIEDDENYAVLK